ncbi:unnamed protein product, partial [Sphagnum tenellum]
MDATSLHWLQESSSWHTWMFDVFLNHRGPDVKHIFVAHLHEALKEAGCRPFLDKVDLEKGQPGQKKIYEALGCASVHVAIFSKHYADSKWCLNELRAMLKSGKVIIPVFYHVSPDFLRCKPHGPYTEAFRKLLRCKPHGPYTEAFRKLLWRRLARKVKQWKVALRKAAELDGFKLDYNGDEAELKRKIVSIVRDHLRASQLPLIGPYQVGLKETSEKLIDTLNQMEKAVGVLSLVGIGGIGKTTLAKEMYRHFENTDMFDKTSILMDVKGSAILDLQKQLAHDLFKEDVRSVGEFNECFNRIRDRKVLIVIDDVDKRRQFDELIPDINKLGLGSRIIITSRESNVVNNIMKNGNCKCSRHDMAVLSTPNSRHLFNWHAFHSIDAIDGFQEVAEKVADACCGLPLALEVIGCFLFDKREERDLESTWPETIKTLLNNEDIFKKLMISYNRLSLEARKMFLDIACFMIGQRERIARQIFEASKSNYKTPATSFSSLMDKCLLKLDEDKQIRMHDLLRDMGRQVVENQSQRMEKVPSHLWNPEIVVQVLQNRKGTNQVRGLSTFGIGCNGIGVIDVAENYRGMSRLHFLLLDGVNVKGDFSDWSRELIWLQWINSDLTTLPSELHLRNLAVLNLTSNKKLMHIWPNDEIIFKDLRTLILSHCGALKALPEDIGKLLKLTELNLASCSSLEALPGSMFHLKELKHLDLSGCVKLEILPMEFGKLKGLVELNLSNCPQLWCLDDSLVHLSQLKTFRLLNCLNLKELPMAFGKLKSLVELELTCCYQLGCLPDSIVHLSQFKTLRLPWCKKLEQLPEDFGKLQSLVYLALTGCSQLGYLPESLVNLSKLEKLILVECNKLTNLPMEFGKLQSLVELNLSYCSQLECLPHSIVELSQLKTFLLPGCDKLTNLPMEFGKLQSLVELDLSDCSQLRYLPNSILDLSQLKTFRLRGCNKLTNLPMKFEKLQNL